MEVNLSSSFTDSDDEPSIPAATSRKSNFASNAKKTSQSSSQFTAEENSVVYHLFLVSKNDEETKNNGNSSIDPKNLAVLQAFALNLSKHYIWHNEPFRLFIADDPKPHFFGRVNVEDNLEDEWFIVYILCQLSKNFPDYVITVYDSDGQFLLIEASDYVPSWLNGEVASNRVFIFRGSVCIVPKHITPRSQFLTDSLLEQLLVDDPGRLFGILRKENIVDRVLAADPVQRSISKRIEAYPDRVSTLRHRFNCVLPAHFVAATNEIGSFILSMAVHAVASTEKREIDKLSPIAFSPSDLITTSIVLTRHLYAKLCSISKSSYDYLNWSCKNDVDRAANERGMKLTKGLEIICANAAKETKNSIQTQDPVGAFDKFMETLKILGYFEEGSISQGYRKKQAKAIYDIQTSCSPDSLSTLVGQNFVSTVKKLGSLDVQTVRQEFPPSEEDDDTWLTITPDQLEKLLASMTTDHSATKNSQPKANKHPIAANGNGCGTVLSTKPKKSNDATEKTVPLATRGIDFNPDAFGDSVKRMLDLHIPHDGNDSSDMDSYGDELLELDEYDIEAAGAIASNMKRYVNMMVNNSAGNKSNKSHSALATRSKDTKPKPGGASAKTIRNAQASEHSPSGDSIEFEDDGFKPVNIDKSAVSSILESYFPESCGQTSSVSSLLHGDRSKGNLNSQKKDRDHQTN